MSKQQEQEMEKRMRLYAAIIQNSNIEPWIRSMARQILNETLIQYLNN